MHRAVVVLAVLSILAACSSDDTTSTPASGGDAGSDAGGGPSKEDAGASADASDAGKDTGSSEGDAGIGQTCIGYGSTGDTCTTEPGKPYGYVCFDGAPPGIAGCKLTRQSSSLGNNYCCEENACVEQVDQGAQCNGVSGKPHRYQCPPTNGGFATPPAGCEEHASGSTDLEKFYCCP